MVGKPQLISGLKHRPQKIYPSGLYYKPIMSVNDDSSIVNKIETSLIDDTRVVIYNRHMFIEQATGPKQCVNSFQGKMEISAAESHL
jgi:hypothetical protein